MNYNLLFSLIFVEQAARLFESLFIII